MTFGSEIETDGSLKIEEAILRVLAKKIKRSDSKVRAAKDHGKKF